MTVNVYINGKRIEEYDPEELDELKERLNDKAFEAIGYKRGGKQ